MSEKLYECMFLVDSNQYASAPQSVVDHLTDIIERANGEVVAHRPWQDGKLAYEIAGHKKGLHYLYCFKTINENAYQEITRSCKLSEMVLRQLIIRQEPVIFDALVGMLGQDPSAVSEAGEDSEEKNTKDQKADQDSDDDEKDDIKDQDSEQEGNDEGDDELES